MSEFVVEAEACPICGASGPCAFDADGRALVHTDLEVAE